MAAKGVNVQNGLQLAGGILGVAQLNAAARAARIEQAATKGYETVAGGGRSSVRAKIDNATDWLPEINPTRNKLNCAECAKRVDDVLAGGSIKPAHATDIEMRYERLADLYGKHFSEILTQKL